jgi:hypothetical protein
MDLAKVNALMATLHAILDSVVKVVMPVILILVAVDLIFGTNLGVLQRAATLVGMSVKDTVLAVLVVYVLHAVVKK